MSSFPLAPHPSKHLAPLTLAGLALLLVWDVMGWDLMLAGWVGSPEGFAWRDHWLLRGVLHDGARRAVLILILALAASLVWPWGPLRGLTRGSRLWLLMAVCSGMLMISVLKQFSHITCPWNLIPFGGDHPYISHWSSSPVQSGGRCFPAGHASSGFAWVAGFFVWPRGSALARRWLVLALTAGLVLGLTQQLRGAHFMSHTLWTGWLCWTWAWALSFFLPASPHANPAG